MKAVSLVALLLWTVAIAEEPQACTICRNTTEVGNPTATLNLGRFGEHSCENVNGLLSFILPNKTSSDCKLIQSAGTLCGCQPLREDGCDICPNAMAFPERSIPIVFDHLPFTVSCEILHALTLSTVDQDDPTCTGTEWTFADYCGCTTVDTEWHEECSLCANGGHVTFSDRIVNITGLPSGTCDQLEEAAQVLFIADSHQCAAVQQTQHAYCGCTGQTTNPCSFCPDGVSKITEPDRPMDFFRPIFEHEGFSGWTPTCAFMESYVSTFDADSDECAALQLSSSYCGCPPRDDPCELCPGEVLSPEYYGEELGRYPGLIPGTTQDLTLTCEMVFAFEKQLSRDEQMCTLTKLRGDLCGCNNGDYSYLQADSISKRGALCWVPRFTTVFSILGSSFIVVDVLREPAKRGRVYNKLVLFMSIFDLIFCAAYVLTTLPVPVHDRFGNELKIYGARGNSATCKAQGFVLEWTGSTSVAFNVTLALYYFLVFIRGLKERRLANTLYSTIFFGAPATIGLALALCALPYYDVMFFGCYVGKPPIVDSWLPTQLIVVTPTLLALAASTIMTLAVYLSIRTRTRGSTPSQRNVLNEERIRNIEHEVFWQSVWYLAAFYVGWPLMIYASLRVTDDSYYFYLVLFTLVPLQGFFNAIVYFRPRVRRWAKRRQHRKVSKASFHERKGFGQFIKRSRSHCDASESPEILFPSNATPPNGGQSSDETNDGTLLDLDARLEPSAMIAGDIAEELRALEVSRRTPEEGVAARSADRERLQSNGPPSVIVEGDEENETEEEKAEEEVEDSMEN